MIQRFSVEAFKSLLDVDVELGRVNVFVGANGSGKSNLLEALGVLGASASGRVDDESLLRRGVRPGVPQLYKSSFRGHRPRGAIRFEARSAKAAYSVELNNPLTDPAPAWRFKTERLESRGQKLFGRSPRSLERLNPEAGYAALKVVDLKPDDPAAELLDALRDYCIYTPSTATLRGLNRDSQFREPLGLSGGRLPEAVLEFLRMRRRDVRLQEISKGMLGLIDWAKSYGSHPVGGVPLSPSAASADRVLAFRDRFMADKRNLLTGYDASEGALYVLFTMILAVHPKAPRVLAIDNVDHALNPRLARALMQELCAWVLESPSPKQVLLTSHNPLILDGLPLLEDAVRLFVVERTNKGRTVVRRVEVDERLLAKAEAGWTLSRLWVMGELGGVPNV